MEEKVNKIRKEFEKGYDCSQVVLKEFADKFGIDKTMALKITSAFGGGVQEGSLCGAFVAGAMVLGLKYGFFEDDNLKEKKEKMMGLMKRYKEEFAKENGSFICKEILGYDVSTEEGLKAAIESNKLLDFCPIVATKAIAIVDKLLNE